MALSADDFLTQMLALLPQGDAWKRSFDNLIVSVLDGFAPEFARVQGRADGVLAEMDPSQTTEMIDEWEETNGLPDACMPALTTIEDRREALLLQLQDQQGHNPADYVAIAVALGHTLATAHRRPYLSFRAGVSRAGDRCQSDAWAHTWILAYMTGLIASPNDFTGWLDSVAVVTADVTGAPDGTITADEMAVPGGLVVAYIALQLPSVVTGICQFDVWLRADSPIELELFLLDTSSNGSAQQTASVDVHWKHFSLRGQDASGIEYVLIQSEVADANNVYVWGAQAGEVDEALECRIATVAQAHTIPIYRVIGSYVPTPD